MFKYGMWLGVAAAIVMTGAAVSAQEVTSEAPAGMTTEAHLEANKAVVRELVDVLNTGNFDALETLVAEDYIQNGAGRPPGRDGLAQTYAAYRAASSNIQWQIDHIVAEGDLVFIFTTLSGTQDGTLFGIPATGREISIHTADLYRLEEGVVVEHWDVWEQYSLLQQLGVIPAA